MAKNHNDRCVCPLFGREILYGECYEVQEVREDEMEMKSARSASGMLWRAARDKRN